MDRYGHLTDDDAIVGITAEDVPLVWCLKDFRRVLHAALEDDWKPGKDPSLHMLRRLDDAEFGILVEAVVREAARRKQDK